MLLFKVESNMGAEVRLRSERGQSAVSYLLILAAVALGLAASLSSEPIKRAFSIMYTDAAMRVAAPGSVDSAGIHQEAEERWGQ